MPCCLQCSFVAAGEGGGADWQCDWTVRPQTYLQDGGPVQGCHMLVPGSSICTACRRFSGDLRCCRPHLGTCADTVIAGDVTYNVGILHGGMWNVAG
jgi:hypothetical protein